MIATFAPDLPGVLATQLSHPPRRPCPPLAAVLVDGDGLELTVTIDESYRVLARLLGPGVDASGTGHAVVTRTSERSASAVAVIRIVGYQIALALAWDEAHGTLATSGAALAEQTDGEAVSRFVTRPHHPFNRVTLDFHGAAPFPSRCHGGRGA